MRLNLRMSMLLVTYCWRSLRSSVADLFRKMLRATAERSSWIFCTSVERSTALLTWGKGEEF